MDKEWVPCAMRKASVFFFMTSVFYVLIVLLENFLPFSKI